VIPGLRGTIVAPEKVKCTGRRRKVEECGAKPLRKKASTVDVEERRADQLCGTKVASEHAKWTKV
jgi:hypothetical protein